MDEKKIKRLELSYKILSIVGWLGLIDVITRSLAQGSTGLSDMGYVSIGLLYVLKFLFGTKIAVGISVFVSMILGLSIFYLLGACDINRRLNKIKNPIK